MVPTDELEGYHKGARIRRRIITGLVLTVVTATVAYGIFARGDSPTDAGRPAPDWELPLLSGAGTLSSDDLSGSPVVLNFWASWCIPCRKEMPLFERTWRTYRDRGIQFVGVNIRDTEEAATKFVKDLVITYPIVRDADQTLAQAMGLIGLPQTFFIDHTGRFLAGSSGLGEISSQELLSQVNELLDRAESGD